MIGITKKNLLLKLIMVPLIFAPMTVQGQEIKNYSGVKQIGSFKGKANYTYKIVEGDTVLEGSFLMQRSSLEALLNEKDASFYLKGTFSDGSPNGQWRFQFGKFQSDSQSEVVDYEYRVLVSGTQQEGLGVISNGRPDGQWTYQIKRIEDSEIVKTLFKSDITFENGIPQKDFQIENENTILVGRFLRNGIAHDEWSSFASDAIEDTESWFFEDGLLRKIEIVKDGISKNISIFGNTENEYKIISLDIPYIEVLQGTVNSESDSIDVTAGIAALLAQNAEYYQKIDTVLSELGPTDFKPKFKAKVPYYKLDSLQRIGLNSISTDFDKAHSISENILKNSHLNIVKRSDPEVLYNYNLTEIIYKDFLEPLERLIKYKELGIIEYLDLHELLSQLWPDGKPNTLITLSEDGTGTLRTFELANAQEFDFKGNDLNSVGHLAAYARQSMETIKESLADQLTTEERLQKLNGLEEDLTALNELLVQRIDSVSKELSGRFKKPLQNIKSLADSSLGTYASLKDPEQKLSYGISIKSCLEQLIELTNTVAALPTKMEEIQDLYLDSIWNPFMATVMDEEVKKRITAAYSKILVPYFIDGINSNLDCENVTQFTDQINLTNERMVELREEDTQKLERKLRKEKNHDEIMRLFYRQATNKEK